MHVKVTLKAAIVLLLILQCAGLYAQDSGFIKVLFLYGSKPAKQYRNVEPKWFGGMLGGHVGIEGDSNSVFNFNPHGSYHLFACKKHLHSIYQVSTDAQFWNIFGGTPDSVKEAIVIIPVTKTSGKYLTALKRLTCKTPLMTMPFWACVVPRQRTMYWPAWAL